MRKSIFQLLDEIDHTTHIHVNLEPTREWEHIRVATDNPIINQIQSRDRYQRRHRALTFKEVDPLFPVECPIIFDLDYWEYDSDKNYQYCGNTYDAISKQRQCLDIMREYDPDVIFMKTHRGYRVITRKLFPWSKIKEVFKKLQEYDLGIDPNTFSFILDTPFLSLDGSEVEVVGKVHDVVIRVDRKYEEFGDLEISQQTPLFVSKDEPLHIQLIVECITEFDAWTDKYKSILSETYYK